MTLEQVVMQAELLELELDVAKLNNKESFSDKKVDITKHTVNAFIFYFKIKNCKISLDSP